VATVTVALHPQGLAVTPNGAHVYVANSGSNTVSVIDTATNTVSATISVGSSPYAVAASADGAHVYVSNIGGASVSVIATATNTVVATVTVGSSPIALAVTPDSAHVYVANEVGDSVSVIATATNTVTDTIFVGVTPIAIAVSPNASVVYVANYASNNVSVINVATNGVTTTLSVNEPQALAVSPDSSQLYVASNTAGLVVFSTSTYAIVATIPITGNAVAVNPIVTLAPTPMFLNDPNGFPNSSAVQVANSSGFAVKIQAGGVTSVVAPFSVSTVPTNSGNAIVASFTETNVTSVGSMTLYWCTPRDSTPLADGSLSSQGVAGALG